MRKKKIEEIRRMLAAAASMCDLSALDEIKNKISKIVRQLDDLESKKTKADGGEQKKRPATSNPKAAIDAIDAEIKQEVKKLSKNQGLMLND